MNRGERKELNEITWLVIKLLSDSARYARHYHRLQHARGQRLVVGRAAPWQLRSFRSFTPKRYVSVT